MSVERDRSKVDFTKDGELKFYPDNPTSKPNKQAFASKQPSQFFDPCAEASKMSLKCMERNNFDRDQCMEYFHAYRDCKKEWQDRRKQDKREGVRW
jgi:cytochrome c oxidase assembly protein subunit 23